MITQGNDGMDRSPPPTAGLLTDFGLADPYVGQMKALLATLAPFARVIDISHEVPAHDAGTAGFFLAASLPWFPGGAVIAAVVDPGVGSSRRIVLLEKMGRMILAPDNGLLTQALDLPGPATARDVTPAPEALKAMPSGTFHGRDAFVPLAARLLNGDPPARLGPALDAGRLVRLGGPPARLENGVLAARVQRVDRFGNAILNLDAASWRTVLASSRNPRLESPGGRDIRPVRTYAELAPGELGIVEGSQGCFELAMDRNSAAGELGLTSGAAIRIRLSGEDET